MKSLGEVAMGIYMATEIDEPAEVTMDRIAAAVVAAHEAAKWKRVEDGLPGFDTPVLAFIPWLGGRKACVEIVRLDNEGDWWLMSSDRGYCVTEPTHWQPLPPAPGGE